MPEDARNDLLKSLRTSALPCLSGGFIITAEDPLFVGTPHLEPPHLDTPASCILDLLSDTDAPRNISIKVGIPRGPNHSSRAFLRSGEEQSVGFLHHLGRISHLFGTE